MLLIALFAIVISCDKSEGNSKPPINEDVRTEANCYIVNPTDDITTLKFPAIARANAFWKTGGGGSASQNPNYPYGYDNHDTNAIDEEDEWYAEVIWSDMDCVSKVSFKQNNTAFGKGTEELLEVTLDGINTQGNIIIGLKKKFEIGYIWSWHIWVSDVTQYVATELPSGQSIMDRNLGARASVGEVGTTDTYGLMYQWGRKDPFPGAATWNLDRDNVTVYTREGSGILWGKGFGSVSFNDGNIAASVSNPFNNYFVTGTNDSDWVKSGSDVDAEISKRWNSTESTSNTSGGKGIKTIFDPCPEGWRMPWGTNWTGFDYDDKRIISQTLPINGSTLVKGNVNTFFPFTGFRRQTVNELFNVSVAGFYWSGTSNSSVHTINDITFTSYSGSTSYYFVNGSENMGRSPRGNGSHVRPVLDF